MKLQDVTTILTVAAATAALTVATLAPVRVGAGDTSGAPGPKIAQPTLSVDGSQLVLVTDQSQYQAGDVPKLQVRAINTTDQAVSTQVSVQLSASAPMTLMSRMMPIPEEIGRKDLTLKLAPGEEKIVAVDLEVPLPRGKTVTATLGNDETAISHPLIVAEDPQMKKIRQAAAQSQVAAVQQANPFVETADEPASE
jgi:hypothetical protein